MYHIELQNRLHISWNIMLVREKGDCPGRQWGRWGLPPCSGDRGSHPDDVSALVLNVVNFSKVMGEYFCIRTWNESGISAHWSQVIMVKSVLRKSYSIHIQHSISNPVPPGRINNPFLIHVIWLDCLAVQFAFGVYNLLVLMEPFPYSSVHILVFYASAFRRRRHYVFGLSVRPSVRPKPEIPSFDMYMGPLVHPTNRNRFTACPSVRPSVRLSVRPSGEVSGHLPENAGREWPEILHADVSWPSSELISV